MRLPAVLPVVLLISLVGYALLGMPALQGSTGSTVAVEGGPFPVEGYLNTAPPGVRASAANGSLTAGVLVPGVRVWLRNAVSGRRSRATKTDLSGRFPVCAHASGRALQRLLEGVRVRLRLLETFFGQRGHVRWNRADPGQAPGRRAGRLWGSVTLQDGSTVHTSDPLFNINSVGRVWLPKSKIIPRAYVNTLGQYILPRVPRTNKITLRAGTSRPSGGR